MKEIDKTKMKRLIKELKWFNNFADYLETNNINMYNESCEYADQKEIDEIKNISYSKGTNGKVIPVLTLGAS